MIENGVVALVNTPPSGATVAPETETRRAAGSRRERASDDVVTPSSAPTIETGLPRGRAAWFDRRLVAAGVGVAVVRFVFAVDRRVFHLFADEPGQLAMARWLSGGTRWTMLDHNTWRPGYALVLVPFARLFEGGEAFVRAALTVNAVLAGLTAVVLARLVHRWSGLSLGASAAVAAATALAPTAISASAYTWSESLITFVVVLALWFVQRFLDDERLTDAVAAVLVSGFALTTHGRAATVLPTTLLICAVVLVRRGRGLQVVPLAALAAGVTIASQFLTARVHDAVWDEINDTNSTDAVIERLDAPVALLDSAVGQVWYQLVATAGLVGIGFAWVLIHTVRPRRPLDRASAIALLATALPPIALSIAFMSDRTRPDQLVYGRYLDTIVWPFTALGLAVIVRRLRSDRPADGRVIIPIVAGAMVVAAFVVAVRHGDQLVDGIGLRMMVPGLLPHVGRGDSIPVLLITTGAFVALLAIVAVSTRRPVTPLTTRRVIAVVTLVGGLLLFSAVRIHDALSINLNSWEIADAAAELADAVPDGEPIGLISDADSRFESILEQRQRYQVYQLYLPDHELVWERNPTDLSTSYVIAPFRNPDLLAADAEVVWRDPDKSIALWRVPERAL